MHKNTNFFKRTIPTCVRGNLLLKAWVVAFFFSISALASPLPNDSLEKYKVNLAFKNAKLIEVLKKIEFQTDLQFTWAEDVEQINNVSIEANKKQLDQVLNALAKQTSVTFKQVNTLIAVTKEKSIKKTNEQPSIEVTGKVTDGQSGEGLPGVNVLVKGTTNGSSTDKDGVYAVQLEDSNATLVFSFIGYLTQEIEVNGKPTIDIALIADAKTLNEVVVVGYGTQDNRKITGAVTSLKSAAIESFPAATIEQSLAGKVPGVQFLQSSGQPGAGFSVRVRGVSSIAGGNEPLYVVDGVPFFNNDVRGFNGLAAINPNDIESVDVLKDAASTAIYGSRGGNGVIMITTKSGKSGKSFAEYNTWAGFSEPRKKLDLMSGDEYRAYVETFYKNSGLALPSDFTKLKTNNTDWQNEVFRQGFKQNHNLVFSGGTEKNKYYTSLGYGNENGIVKGSDFEKYSFLTRLDNKISDIFSIQSSVTAARTEQNGPYPADNNNTLSITKTGVGSTLLALPTEPVRNTDGTYSNVFSAYSFAFQLENPVAYAKEALNKYTDTRVIGSITLSTKIAPYLTNRTRVGINYLSRRNDVYFPKIFQVVYGSLGYAILDTRQSTDYIAENFIEFKKQILPKVELNAIAGASIQSENSASYHIEGQGFISDDLKNNAIQAAATTSVPQTYLYQRRLASAFGRINLNYDERYILEANIRGDGASVFSANNKVAIFPSVAFSWLMSNENFFQEIPFVSYSKLRVSWGQSGNQAIQPYQSLPIGSLVSATQSGGVLAVGLTPNLPNSSITWETSTQSNIGIDIGLFKSKLRFVFDYYTKKTTGALSTVQLAPTSGFNNIIDNVGEIENTGVELGLDAEIIKNESFKFTAGLNLSQNINKVTKTKNNQAVRDVPTSSNFNTAPITGYSSIEQGQPLGAISGFVFKGFEAGTPTYQDVDGNGKIDTKDLQVIGNPYPKFLFGFNLNLSYKRLSLSTNWQGVYKAQLYNVTLFNLVSPQVGFNRSKEILNYYPTPKQNAVAYPSDLFIEDASFLRLKNIRLDYNFPLNSKVFKRLNVYASAQNLLTFTSYKGYDPEVNSFSGTDLKQGYDNAAYPTAKSYVFGLSVQF